MDVRNTQEALSKLLLQINSSQLLPETKPDILISVQNVKTAQLQSLLDKIMLSVGQSISQTEMSVLKLALFSDSIQTDSTTNQQHFLQSVLKLFEEKDLSPRQTDFLKTALSKSEIIRQSFNSLNISESKPLSDLVNKLTAENADMKPLVELPQKLQKILDSQDIEPLIKALKEIATPAPTPQATDKKLVQLLLNLVKHSESSHPANNRSEVQDIEKIIRLLIRNELVSPANQSSNNFNNLTLGKLLKLADNMPKANENLRTAVKSALTLSLIRLSAELKSPDILKSALEIFTSNNTSVRTVLEVLVPLLKSGTENLPKNVRNGSAMPETQNYTALKAPESQAEKDKFVKPSITEKERQISETLNKLNDAANKLNLPNYQILPLPFLKHQAEINFRPLKKSIKDQQNDSNNSYKESENLECTVNFPTLGPVNIKISLLDKNVGVALSAESKLSCCQIEKEFDNLSAALIGNGFEKPILGINQKPTEQVKPDWLMNLISLQKTC